MTNRLRRADPVGRLLTDPEVATPAFVIDDAKLQVNLDFAKEKAARLGVTLRPHLKTAANTMPRKLRKLLAGGFAVLC